MGYSIGVHARSLKLRDKMCDFMEANLKQPHELFPDLNESWVGVKTDLGYIKGKRLIGFDYGAWREWKHILLRWIAIQIGSKRTMQLPWKDSYFVPVNPYFEKVYWYNYDSASICAIKVMTLEDYNKMFDALSLEEVKDYEDSCTFVDKYGWPLWIISNKVGRYGPRTSEDWPIEYRQSLIQESIRLDDLWQKTFK